MEIRKKQAERVTEYLLSRHAEGPRFDPLPRVLSGDAFTHLEQGLIQRINALNLFLNDIYGHRMILRDGIIPEEFVYSSPAYRTACVSASPIKRIYTHLSATDLICEGDGTWYAVEDDLLTPSDCVYPHLARKLCRAEAPEQYEMDTLCDNCGLDILLNQLYSDLRDGLENASEGIVVILDQSGAEEPTFQASYLAEITGAVVARPGELTVMDDAVYYRGAEKGGFQKVAVIHRLEPDGLLDPLCMGGDYRRGVPHLMEAYRRGRVAIVNAPGCGIACDRGLYYFVPDMIRYYLLEEPIIPNVPTLLPWKKDDREQIMDDLRNLILINVSAEGKGSVVAGGRLTTSERDRLGAAILANPRRYVAQTMLHPSPLTRLDQGGAATEDTEACFRALTVCSNSTRVWMGGSTQFLSAGVFQDTWILSE